MKVIYQAAIFICMFVACEKSRLLPHEDLPVLQERFHGKYKPVSSISSEAIDVNLDGVASTNMLTEVPDLPGSELEIRIYAINNSLFVQFWPEQDFGYEPRPLAYRPNMVIHYLQQSRTRLFTFSPDLTELVIKPDDVPLQDSIRFPVPSSVTIEANDEIKVVSPRQLFTRPGWKKVEVTTVYKRYTKQT
jgi:hypothetical protein